jgi:hypothetical protein
MDHITFCIERSGTLIDLDVDFEYEAAQAETAHSPRYQEEIFIHDIRDHHGNIAVLTTDEAARLINRIQEKAVQNRQLVNG